MKSKKCNLEEICRKFDISLLYFFGSQQKAAKQISDGHLVEIDDTMTDIDIGVVFYGPLPFGRARVKLYSQIFNELEDLFLPVETDLVFLEENHSVFQAEAIKGICAYAADTELRELYEESVLRRACDFRPFLEKYYDELLEAKENG